MDNFAELAGAVREARNVNATAAEAQAMDCIERMLDARTPVAFPECLPLATPVGKRFGGLRVSLLRRPITGGGGKSMWAGASRSPKSR